MIQGKEIDSLVDLLTARGINLYHGCQWADIAFYFELGALAPGAELKREGLGAVGDPTATAGVSPWMDARIHFTLSDVGSAYAQDTSNLPNPRGPIVLQILPGALREAVEVGICLRPEGADDSSLEDENFLPLKDVQYLFRYTPEAPLPEKTYLKSPEALEKEFGVGNVISPEVFCRFAGDRLSFEYIHKIMVDHYQIHNREFRDWLYELQYQSGTGFLIERRYCPADIGGYLSNSLSKILREGVPTLDELSRHPDEKISQWAKGHLDNNREALYRRFAHGLRQGTLLPLEVLAERYLSEMRTRGRKKGSAKPILNAQTRELIAKLRAENVPADSIARIVDVPLEAVTRFLDRSGNE